MDKDQINQELVFKAIRSSGPGGQHVNKVSTKVLLIFDLLNSKGLNDKEKQKVAEKLSNQINKEGILQITSDSSRSQLKNRTIVTNRFFGLIEDALKVQKKRKATKPSKTAIEKRLKEKKIASERKSNRGKPERDF